MRLGVIYADSTSALTCLAINVLISSYTNTEGITSFIPRNSISLCEEDVETQLASSPTALRNGEEAEEGANKIIFAR